jgi:hypothetical protein
LCYLQQHPHLHPHLGGRGLRTLILGLPLSPPSSFSIFLSNCLSLSPSASGTAASAARGARRLARRRSGGRPARRRSRGCGGRIRRRRRELRLSFVPGDARQGLPRFAAELPPSGVGHRQVVHRDGSSCWKPMRRGAAVPAILRRCRPRDSEVRLAGAGSGRRRCSDRGAGDVSGLEAAAGEGGRAPSPPRDPVARSSLSCLRSSISPTVAGANCLVDWGWG